MNIFKQSLHFLGLIRESKIQCSTSVFLPFRLTLYAKTFGRFYRSPRRLTNKSKAHRNPTSSGNALNQYLTVNPLAWLSNWLRKVFLYNCKRRAGEKLMNLPEKVGGIPKIQGINIMHACEILLLVSNWWERKFCVRAGCFSAIIFHPLPPRHWRWKSCSLRCRWEFALSSPNAARIINNCAECGCVGACKYLRSPHLSFAYISRIRRVVNN